MGESAAQGRRVKPEEMVLEADVEEVPEEEEPAQSSSGGQSGSSSGGGGTEQEETKYHT